jgi:hypothetical protein
MPMPKHAQTGMLCPDLLCMCGLCTLPRVAPRIKQRADKSRTAGWPSKTLSMYAFLHLPSYEVGVTMCGHACSKSVLLCFKGVLQLLLLIIHQHRQPLPPHSAVTMQPACLTCSVVCF